MRDYSKVSPDIWSSHRFRGLPDQTARYGMLYVLTNAHQNLIGCYRLPATYAAEDTGLALVKWQSALEALVEAELIAFDSHTDEIFIRRWFVHNPPTNSKHFLGCERAARKVQSPTLRELVASELSAASCSWRGLTANGATPRLPR
jgi:hypothetical protein